MMNFQNTCFKQIENYNSNTLDKKKLLPNIVFFLGLEFLVFKYWKLLFELAYQSDP